MPTLDEIFYLKPVYLVLRSSLDQHFTLLVKEEHTECPVQLHISSGHINSMAIRLTAVTYGAIIFINQNAVLLKGLFLQCIMDFGKCCLGTALSLQCFANCSEDIVF